MRNLISQKLEKFFFPMSNSKPNNLPLIIIITVTDQSSGR